MPNTYPVKHPRRRAILVAAAAALVMLAGLGYAAAHRAHWLNPPQATSAQQAMAKEIVLLNAFQGVPPELAAEAVTTPWRLQEKDLLAARQKVSEACNSYTVFGRIPEQYQIACTLAAQPSDAVASRSSH